MASYNQFYIIKDTIIFNDNASLDLLDNFDKNILKSNNIIKFDVRKVINSIEVFFKKLFNLIIDIDVNGVTMYLSKELSIITNYESQIGASENLIKTKNSFVILDSPNKVDVIFFDGVEKISIKSIIDNLGNYKNKDVVFNFSNLSLNSLNEFIPIFIGGITNSRLRKISFSEHFGIINDILEKKGVYCMVKVSGAIYNPKRKINKIKISNNKKINEFLNFANYGALQF